MKNTFEKICRKANDSGYYEFCNINPDSPIRLIAVGRDWNKYDADIAIVGSQSASLEVWIYSEIELEYVSDSFRKLVTEYNALTVDADDLFDRTGVYEYHFSFIPKSRISNIWTEIYPLDDRPIIYPNNGCVTVIGDNGKIGTVDKDSLAGFAISHGCDFMDMSSMTTYHGI